jgi:hypothetical protein
MHKGTGTNGSPYAYFIMNEPEGIGN